MERVEIASLYKATPADGTRVTVCGWAKTVRDSKKIGFISLTDGSCYKPVQIVFQADKLENYTEIAKSGLYTSFEVNGTLVLTPEATNELIEKSYDPQNGARPVKRAIQTYVEDQLTDVLLARPTQKRITIKRLAKKNN